MITISTSSSGPIVQYSIFQHFRTRKIETHRFENHSSLKRNSHKLWITTDWSEGSKMQKDKTTRSIVNNISNYFLSTRFIDRSFKPQEPRILKFSKNYANPTTTTEYKAPKSNLYLPLISPSHTKVSTSITQSTNSKNESKTHHSRVFLFQIWPRAKAKAMVSNLRAYFLGSQQYI